MTKKSPWNRAHEAVREDERTRALADLHDYITKLERDAAAALAECARMSAEMQALHDRLIEVLDENFGLQPTPATIEDAITSIDQLIRQDHRRWREALLERDSYKAKLEETK
jgi:hypothetical protein